MTTKFRLAFVVVPSENPEASREFYTRLVGTDFARSLWSEDGFNSSVAGVDFDIEKRRSPEEATTPYYAVDNLDDVLREATDAGARVVFGPVDMRMPKKHLSTLKQASKGADQAEKVAELGRVAVIVDPGGAQLGLTELGQHVGERVGEYQRSVLDRFPQLRTQDTSS